MTLYIITGTTRGLGEAFVDVLEDEELLTINRREPILKKSQKNIVCDLANITTKDLDTFENTLKELFKRGFTKAVFINNAFTMGKLDKFMNLEESVIRETIGTNLLASTLLIQRFIQVVEKYPLEKRVINISSGASKRALDGWSLYCMTKASLEMFVESIKIENSEILAYNVDPGVLNTDMQKDIREYKEGKDNSYFQKLHQQGELQETVEVAKKILQRYG